MRIVSYSLVAVALLLGGAGCADDSFKRNEPRLVLKAYTCQGGVACAYDQAYPVVDDAAHLIDLGDVPMFATKWAIWEMQNDTQQALKVTAVSYTNTVGQRWDPPQWVPRTSEDDRPPRPFFDAGEGFPVLAPPYSEYLLGIPYSPVEEGLHQAEIVIASNAANADTDNPIRATVKARAVFTGAPDIELEYNSFRGPDSTTDCVDVDTDGRVDGCLIPAAQALDFGNIGLGASGSERLIIRNKAECAAYVGVDPCELCKITVAADPTRQNLGLSFKAGTNDAGYFEFAGSNATPFDIRQRNIDPSCTQTGDVRILLNFKAPPVEGVHTAVLVIESNDPDEPLIELPLRAASRNAPIAVAKFREIDPGNPTAPYTNPADIDPLERVYFDGRDSYDPIDPGNPARIATHSWEVEEAPAGANPLDFQMQGQTSSLFSFWLPLAGHYVVKLTVWNTDGIQSGDTESSRVEFDVVPKDAIHVQLVWDNSTNDQDLHMTFVPQDDRVCNIPWDCHYRNVRPVWFASDASGAGANPRLDIDDTNGLGPENINIDTPEPGTYRLYVHYFDDYNTGSSMPTRNTIRVYLNGVQVAEYRRTLSTDKAIWAVADILWLADGTGTITPYPADEAGQIGAVSQMQACMTPGWSFF
jgi:uncharacterized protein YfaP (DUF2135 family)